jgi:two-component system, NarL family, nitrate/nitrite response regulator NarL
MARKAGPQSRTSAIRLIVADQNLMNCQLLVAALRRCRRIEVVARATSSEQILAEARASQPSVALIGAHLQDGSSTGFEVVRSLRELHPEIRAVLLLDSADRASVIDAFRAGAKGIFSRDNSLGVLCRCIQSVHAGETWASSEQIEAVLEVFARIAPLLLPDKSRIPLSRREREVAELVAQGLSNREISAQLRLSQHTIKNYLFQIYGKLGMSSRVDLVLHVRSADRPSPDQPDKSGKRT